MQEAVARPEDEAAAVGADIEGPVVWHRLTHLVCPPHGPIGRRDSEQRAAARAHKQNGAVVAQGDVPRQGVRKVVSPLLLAGPDLQSPHHPLGALRARSFATAKGCEDDRTIWARQHGAGSPPLIAAGEALRPPLSSRCRDQGAEPARSRADEDEGSIRADHRAGGSRPRIIGAAAELRRQGRPRRPRECLPGKGAAQGAVRASPHRGRRVKRLNQGALFRATSTCT
mmetsp:Transcript_42279/g.119606  ORF Transcript_42279/g.119606 Transcript_42279/m.119606 type:complete len:227 (-) Transcript_42279:8-688(-)